MLRKEAVEVIEIGDPGFLVRMFPLLGPGRKRGALYFRLRKKLENYFIDRSVVRKLRTVDAIVLCTQTPNGFWRREYGIESLRKSVSVPLVYHEVYYLGNAPSQVKRLEENNECGIDRYEWHLAVSPITEIFSEELPPWSVIGVNLEAARLNIPRTKKTQAIVDFPQPGYEQERKVIISALKNTEFPYIELEDKLPKEFIRSIYRESSNLFLSSPEAFGVPIAECLSSGTAVFTADPSWPMSWRLPRSLIPSGEYNLPKNCFWVYSNQAQLERKLLEFLHLPIDYSQTVRSNFLTNYPEFYHGK